MLSAGWVSAMDGIAISTHYTPDKADSVHFPRFGNLIRHDIKNDGVVKSAPSYCRKSRLDFGSGNGFFDQAAEFFREVGHGDDGLESNTDFFGIVLSFSECLA